MKVFCKLVLCYILLFYLNAQTSVIDGCLAALQGVNNPSIDQPTADKLTNAILKGNKYKIKKLAEPWLNQEVIRERGGIWYTQDRMHEIHFPERLFKSHDISSANLFWFTARLASSLEAQDSSISDKVIESLKTLVDMGFTVDHVGLEESTSFTPFVLDLDWSWLFLERSKHDKSRRHLTETRHQLIDTIITAGLTFPETVSRSTYGIRSPIHSALLVADQNYFDYLISSIGEPNVNLPFVPSDADIKLKKNAVSDMMMLTHAGHTIDIHQYAHYPTAATLLHWYVGLENARKESVNTLIELGADPNVKISKVDEEHQNAPMGETPLETATLAKNIPVTIELLKAGADYKLLPENTWSTVFLDIYVKPIYNYEEN